ncbi:MAG: ABC transporter ATP-binding protein [Sneathiella sp.]|nr:ABC transporter ATP-binding protein [Sneathiella sp.]
MQGLQLDNLVTVFEGGGQIGPVSLTLDRGQMLALIGGSGSGKTTTLRMIAGLAPINGGSLYFDNQDITNLPPKARRVGMVFQNFGLFPHLDVSQNISFGLRMTRRGKEITASKLAWILKILKLEGLQDRYASQLSGGQKQRVALARTLVMDPDILLLDEPLSNLDANLREETGHFIRELQQELEITTVFVTHDQEEALMLADQVAVMANGEVLQQASPEDIFNFPTTEKVARFIGGSNIIHGEFTEEGIFKFSAGLIRPHEKRDMRTSLNHKVMIRSEHIEIYSENDDKGASNSFGGVIASHRFYGTHMRYHVKAGDEDLIIRHRTRNQFEVGDKVTLSVDPEHVWPIETAI